MHGRVDHDLGIDQDEIRVPGEQHVLLEHAIVGVDHRECAGRRVRRDDGGNARPPRPRLVSHRLGGVHRFATAEAEDHGRPFLLCNSSQSFDLALGAFAAEHLSDQSYSGLCEGLLDLLACESPHALVGDHERFLAELLDVVPEG